MKNIYIIILDKYFLICYNSASVGYRPIKKPTLPQRCGVVGDPTEVNGTTIMSP